MKHESIRSVFDWNTGEPSIFRPLQAAAKLRDSGTARVERDRATGQDRSAFYGLSRKSDEKLNTRRVYSPLVEGAEAGQRAAHRRDAIRRGGI